MVRKAKSILIKYFSMKKAFLVFGCIIILFGSCKKDSDSPSYTQDQINGVWQRAYDDCLQQLTITTSEMSQKDTCSDGFYQVQNYGPYSFNGQKISGTDEMFGIKFDFVITDLTETKLETDVLMDGEKVGSYNYERIE